MNGLSFTTPHETTCISVVIYKPWVQHVQAVGVACTGCGCDMHRLGMACTGCGCGMHWLSRLCLSDINFSLQCIEIALHLCYGDINYISLFD